MKEIFGKGLFIRNDENRNPCRIGDVVKVTVPKMEFNGWEEKWIQIGEHSYEGILCLLKSKGVQIRLSGGNYIKPHTTNMGYQKWKWKLIKSIE